MAVVDNCECPSKQLLDETHVGPVFQHVRGAGVPEHVTTPFTGHSRRLQQVGHKAMLSSMNRAVGREPRGETAETRAPEVLRSGYRRMRRLCR